ncbi:MAG TPA: cell wall hydrolase [Magnetovibrio sp.]
MTANRNSLTPEMILHTYRRAKERRRIWEQHWQFSCWNENDPNRQKILAVEPGQKTFDTCVRLAKRAVSGCLEDITKGATHYHTKTVTPVWSRGRPICAEVGNHQFYNTIE